MAYFATPYDWPRPVCANEDSELWPINAMRDRGVTLETINWKEGWVAFSNGIKLPIVALYDADGFRVEEWEDARTYDFGDPRFGYGTAKCASDHVEWLH